MKITASWKPLGERTVRFLEGRGVIYVALYFLLLGGGLDVGSTLFLFSKFGVQYEHNRMAVQAWRISPLLGLAYMGYSVLFPLQGLVYHAPGKRLFQLSRWLFLGFSIYFGVSHLLAGSLNILGYLRYLSMTRLH